jgi:hypothetical protein
LVTALQIPHHINGYYLRDSILGSSIMLVDLNLLPRRANLSFYFRTCNQRLCSVQPLHRLQLGVAIRCLLGRLQIGYRRYWWGFPFNFTTHCLFVPNVVSCYLDSLSSTPIASLKAWWQCWRYTWHLALRSKSWWRSEARSTLLWWESGRRIVEPRWYERLWSTITSL